MAPNQKFIDMAQQKINDLNATMEIVVTSPKFYDNDIQRLCNAIEELNKQILEQLGYDE